MVKLFIKVGQVLTLSQRGMAQTEKIQFRSLNFKLLLKVTVNLNSSIFK